MPTLREILKTNYADSNANSGIKDNLLFSLAGDFDHEKNGVIESTDFYLTGDLSEDNLTIDKAESIYIGDDYEMPLDEKVEINEDGISVNFENGHRLSICVLGYVNLK